MVRAWRFGARLSFSSNNHGLADMWRLFLGLVGLLVSAACATSSGPRQGSSEQDTQALQPPPNIVLIMADDLGWSDVSTYGLDRVPTPNIDRIAAAGVAFTHGYVTSPACAPSRAGLMTGRYPQAFGFEYNMFPQDGTRGLPASETTLAEVLKSAGYRTGLVGKWHQGVEDHQYPTNRGFDEFFGFLSGTITYVDPEAPGIVNARPDAAPETTPRDAASEVYTGPERRVVDNYDRYLTHELTREAVEFIERNTAGPFFLYLAHHAPHRPLQVPQAYYDRFNHIEDHDRRVFVAMIAAMDEGIGEVLDTLDANGLSDNTLIVFFSDNGCPTRFGVCDCTSLVNAGKFTHLEGGLRVPFMMAWPAALERRGLVHEPVIAIDLFPTLAAAAGAPFPEAPLHGVDLLAALQSGAQTLSERALFWRQSPVRAVRRGQWKLIDNGGHLPLQLFDLDADPGETRNLAELHPEIVERLRGELGDWEGGLSAPNWPLFFEQTVTVCERDAYAVY